MRIGFISGILLWLFIAGAYTQTKVSDSPASISLSEIVITESMESLQNRNSTQHTDVAERSFLREKFTGNIVQSLNNIPGIHSMDIGSGFSKPMIRGMGFNRIAVVENGLKQEGQQWGADHGLEIDAFNIDRVNILKGPASLAYGSDAIGGVIEMTHENFRSGNEIFGDASLLYKSVNNTFGGSLKLGINKKGWLTTFRYSEQHYSDYRVPTDTIVYLTQKLPVYGKKLKNTAGYERNASLSSNYWKERYEMYYFVSNVYQKTGFFPGAHGVPDASRLEDDGKHRNIELPYSRVNHFKAMAGQKYKRDEFTLSADIGYQNNHREEMSLFHTHYGSQQAPGKNPDKELGFNLDTYSLSAKGRIWKQNWEHTFGWDIQYQNNTISGYSFLLPEYNRFTTGVFLITGYNLSPVLKLSGGIRYDYGRMKISSYTDPYLEVYLQQQNYGQEIVDLYKWRSYGVNFHTGNFSGSAGTVWNPYAGHIFQFNIGHSYRLPTANELASNGVHHGTFRHEQGDPTLGPEKGWQLDVAYMYEKNGIKATITPFVSWFSNYIYLQPTNEWSILPHAGLIYRYTSTEAVFGGGEISVSTDICHSLNYTVNGEYVYTRNNERKTALSFSPPASMRNILTWSGKLYKAGGEWQLITNQNRIANNENKTPGAGLVHLFASGDLYIGKTAVEITSYVRNLFDKKYYNHLSFYRKVEIPEPGRNFQILIKIPFKSSIK